MSDGFVVIAALLVPDRSSRMKLIDLVGMEYPQASLKDLSKEGVVAIPVPLVIERDDQQVCPFESFEAKLAIPLLGYGLA